MTTVDELDAYERAGYTTITTIKVERGWDGEHYRTDYRCTGPDGAEYAGQPNIAVLKSLLRRHYGHIDLVFVDGPTWRRTP